MVGHVSDTAVFKTSSPETPKARWAVKVRIALGARRAPREEQHEEELFGHGASSPHGPSTPVQYRTDSTVGIERHLPGEICNLARSEPAFTDGKTMTRSRSG